MTPNAHKHICYAQNYHRSNAQPLNKSQSNNDRSTIEINETNVLNTQIILVECHYDIDLLRPLLSALPSVLPEHNDMYESRFRKLNWAIELITLESEFERLGRFAMINLWTNIMMVKCLRNYLESLPEKSDNWLTALKDPYLSKALTIMHDMPNHKWTI